MSLWYKQIDEITFQDFEDFCQLRHKEGTRLDYKRSIPNDLQNLVAAFANTLGGLILLGVDSDRLTNESIWPPVGMPAQRGMEERITQICQDNIYPPVRPQISRLLDNPHAQGTVVAVLRVDESPEAPHAVDQGRRIYERTGNLNTPYDLADINRIQNLLRRREKIEQEREAYINDQIARSTRLLAEPRLQLTQLAGIRPHNPKSAMAPQTLPLRWASIVPYYPWRALSDPETCWHTLKLWRDARDVQRIPDGAFAQKRDSYTSQNFVVGSSSLTARGHFFAIECTMETVWVYQTHYESFGDKQDHRWLNYENLCDFSQAAFKFAADFYGEPNVELPGLVHLSVGIIDALGFRMDRDRDTGKPFINQHFQAETAVTINALLEDTRKAANSLFQQLAFGFDLPPKLTN